MTHTSVGELLLPAFNLLPPFPWEAYVDEVLFLHWGERKEAAEALLASLQGVAASRKVDLPAGRFSFLCRVQLNTYDSRELGEGPDAGAFLTSHLISAQTTSMPDMDGFDDLFRLKVSVMMPLGQGDRLFLNGLEELWYSPLPSATSQGDRFEPVKLAGGRAGELKAWVRRYADMAADMVDVERAIHGVMEQMQREWHPVAHLAYPQFDMVFPGKAPEPPKYDKSEYVNHKAYLEKMKRFKPIAPKFLDRLLHEDDQEVIRTMFDQAAAGAKLVAKEDKLNMSILRVDYEGD